MSRIYLGGAGGAPTNNVIRSLREAPERDYLIGASSSAADLLLADVDERHVAPRADDPQYSEYLLALLRRVGADFIHVQNDLEVVAVSRLRAEIERLGVRTFLPSAEAVEVFVNKYTSFGRWASAGLPVPDTLLVKDPQDLTCAFQRFGENIWIRATTGGGGRGALPTDDLELARRWI